MVTSVCFIPLCRTGYASDRKKRKQEQNYKKISLFGAPKNDEALFKKWQRKIPRNGFKLTDKVCEIHFKEDEIIRFYETKLTDGTIHRIERDNPRLKPGAVPSIFPNLPKYLSFEVKQRKPPKERKPLQIQKRKRRSHPAEPEPEPEPELDCDAPDEPNDSDSSIIIIDDYDFLKLLADLEIIMINWPDWLCNRISIEEEDVVFMIHIDAAEKLPDKYIRIDNNLDVLGFLCGNEKVQLPCSKLKNSIDVYNVLKFMSEFKR
ncbi:uncharacterized protein LOC135833158 [Planococcus citri]|uniref:uncharacterized protein LOC135833158 n=1 Tax=Planococcus citri TaxID=170843 RepID=UPI0031F9B2C4